MFCISTHNAFLLLLGLWGKVDPGSGGVNAFNFQVNEQKFIDKNNKRVPINYPIVVNTWPFTNATSRAWDTLVDTDDALQAIQDGCSECEELRCDGTVGWGGSPDENGESTLDALIMDGPTHSAGSVAGMKRIKNAIGVARAVMNYTKHTLLVGDAATSFAIDMGFQQQDIHSKESMEQWLNWMNNKCQPNFRINVSPDAEKSCGPYKPLPDKPYKQQRFNENVSAKSHDTIGMIAINSAGDMAAGTSTNGANHKVPGRVGDSPIIGSGAYVDNDVGAACGTGDGDTMMRFLPSYQAVESMRRGMTPSEASQDAIERIVRKYPKFTGAIVAMDRYGNHGAGCHGLDTFAYSVKDGSSSDVQLIKVKCV